MGASKEPLKVYSEFESFEKEVLNIQSKDTLYVINFWATWCGPCVKELPHFEALGDTLNGKHIEVLLTSLDMKRKIQSDLEPFIKRKKLKKKVIALTDSKYNSWLNKVDSSWTGSIPATVLLLNGEKVFYEKSYHTKEELEKDIVNHIKNNP